MLISFFPSASPSDEAKESSSFNQRKTSTDGSRDGGDHGRNKGSHTTTILHREHTRVVYNLELIENILISYSQDRKLVAFCLDSQKVLFSLPTLGNTVNNMSFCPHDSSWLAMGLQEGSVKMINLHSTPSYKCKTFSHDIEGKVLALSWNPTEEGKILFGTGDGQVGVVDVNSGRITSYAFFHQKPVYKVEWAPPVLAQQFPALKGIMCAYSFGDRQVVMRNPKTPMADPVMLTLVHKKLPQNISEFAFSPDYIFLAIGCQDGNISIYRSSDLIEIAKLSFVHKNIQHLLWKISPTTGDLAEKCKQYKLIIASSDSKICIMELGSILREQIDLLERDNSDASGDETSGKVAEIEPVVVTACTRELTGHANRVVWVSCSSHDPSLLASASYDHTCQVWNMDTGEAIGNYRGHLSRVFRVEFSPDEADLLYSFADENSVHHWRISDLEDNAPPEKTLKAPLEVIPQLVGLAISGPEKSSASEEKSNKATNGGAHTIRSERKRQVVHKSLFPLLHTASAHKKSFFLLALSCMAENKKLTDASAGQQDEKSLDDLLDDDEYLR